MKILGDAIFAKNENGKLKSRIGTIFFRTPGLVTLPGVHAMQRVAWIEEINRQRKEEGLGGLSENEIAEEVAQSADLIFTEEAVLIRPDPKRMDLAIKADDALQEMLPKHKIRFLNTHQFEVRNTLKVRGENWRMAVKPVAQEEVVREIEKAKSAINLDAVYYYNSTTGTRWLTAGTFTEVVQIGDAQRRRAQLAEIVKGLKAYNRLGQSEINLFPAAHLPVELKGAIAALDLAAGDEELFARADALALEYRMAVPAKLRDESAGNLAWRNEMNLTLMRGPNETAATDDDLIQGISPEFFRQIEWLPGARIDNGEVVFDSFFDYARRLQEPELLAMCDERVKGLVFNLVRLFTSVEYVNVGRIGESLARKPIAGARRGTVYMFQFKVRDYEKELLYIVRFQKWGVAEHLDEGKDMLRAIYEAANYNDYILDRRLACCQFGMRLADKLGFGQITETYRGANPQYNGAYVKANYFMRAYITGTASDKVPVARFANPAFARRFAELMGEAAALDMILGRRATETGENVFDTNYEVLRPGADGIPLEIAVTDHAGAFVSYKEPFEELAAPYARVVTRREEYVADYAAFAKAYVAAFERKLAEAQAHYRSRRRVYDDLFLHRPYDTAGSTAYRWHCILERLDKCEPAAIARVLAGAIQSAGKAK